MNTNTAALDLSRAEFEATEDRDRLARAWGFGESADDYADPYVQARWVGWQRARAALAAKGQQEPVGWVYGTCYWEVGNPRLTDHIKQFGQPRFAAPVAQQSEPVARVDEGDDGLFVEILYGVDGSPLKLGDSLYLHPPVAQQSEAALLHALQRIADEPADGEPWVIASEALAKHASQPTEAGAPTVAADESMLVANLRRTLGNIKDATRLADVRSLANLGLGFLDAAPTSGRESAAVACIEAIAKLDTRKDTVESCKAVAQRWLRDNPAGRESAAPAAPVREGDREQDAKDAAAKIVRDVCELDYTGEDWDAEKMLSVTVEDLGLIAERAIDAAMQKGGAV